MQESTYLSLKNAVMGLPGQNPSQFSFSHNGYSPKPQHSGSPNQGIDFLEFSIEDHSQDSQNFPPKINSFRNQTNNQIPNINIKSPSIYHVSGSENRFHLANRGLPPYIPNINLVNPHLAVKKEDPETKQNRELLSKVEIIYELNDTRRMNLESKFESDEKLEECYKLKQDLKVLKTVLFRNRKR